MTVEQLLARLSMVQDKKCPITIGAILPDLRRVYFENASIDCEEQDGEFIMSVDMKEL